MVFLLNKCELGTSKALGEKENTWEIANSSLLSDRKHFLLLLQHTAQLFEKNNIVKINQAYFGQSYKRFVFWDKQNWEHYKVEEALK